MVSSCTIDSAGQVQISEGQGYCSVQLRPRARLYNETWQVKAFPLCSRGVEHGCVMRLDCCVLAPTTQVLEACCACSSARGAQTAALQAVRTGLQGAVAAASSSSSTSAADPAAAGGRQRRWAEACALRAIPAAAAEVHEIMCSGSAASLDVDALQVGLTLWA